MRLFITLCLFLASLLGYAQNDSFKPGEVLIQVTKKEQIETVIRSFEKEHGISISSYNELSDIALIYRISFQDSTTDLDFVIKTMARYEGVYAVQKNHYISLRETIPDDTEFAQQWHLNNTGADGGTVDADIDAVEAWDITTGGVTTHGDTIVVCIIEGGGADISHIDLQENIWKNYAEIPDDGIDNDGNGYVDDYMGWNVQDENDLVGSGSHGTRVCGMIGAKGDNATGVSGVNWDVKMMIVKGQSASDEASVIEAYSYPLKMRKMYNDSYGEEGAFVVVTNSSWGIDNGDPEDSPLWCAMYDALGEEGILSVAATTNNNVDVEISGDLPTTCTSPYLIGVTMTNNTDIRAGSGYGTTSVDLAAPGSDVRLTFPGDLYTSTSGTSFATPCVSGAVALAFSAPCAEYIAMVKADPAAAALQMKAYILDGVDEIGVLADEVLSGGRLNVFNTINLMMDGCDPDACIAPYNIRSLDLSDTSINVAWDGFATEYIFTITEIGGSSSTTVVEDLYELNIDTLQPCTEYEVLIQADCDGDGLSDLSFPFLFTSDGCCTNPPLTLAERTNSTLTLEWNPILYATQYDFRYRETDTETWTTLTDVSSPLEITELTNCVDYDFQIYTLCGDSTRGFSDSYVYRTKGCGACTEEDYCDVLSGNDNLEWIDAVTINDFSNETGQDNGWLVSEQIITALTPGESYTLTVKPGFAGTTYTERFSVYIDFNKNGEFDIPEERVVNNFSVIGTMNTTITIPDDAPIGITKFRIGMSALSEPVPCPTSSFYGEYEDYCVYIGPQNSNVEENNMETIVLYPNPANDVVYLTAETTVESIEIYAQDGRLIRSVTGNENRIDLSELSKGVYLVVINTVEGSVTKKLIKQ